MTRFVVSQSPPLSGRVKISGSKNSVLPIITASLLSEGRSIIEDIPALEDVNVICDVLNNFGVKTQRVNSKLFIDVDDITSYQAPYELVRKMRASFLVLGPLLARLGRVKISLPGGCAIGTRPIDLHLKALRALGADISLGHGYIEATTRGSKGSRIYLDFPSVGATENAIMSAALADGVTVIENAAEEPEIIDLANFINSMGGNVKGAGTDTIKIEGVSRLKGTTHSVIPDRIEAGTFMVATAMNGGDVILENVIIDHLKPVEAKLKEAGVEILEVPCGIRVVSNGRVKAVDIKTLPYPGFPTDMQAPMMALLSVARGTSIVIETIFENRFMHVAELKRMGANIKIEGRSAIIEGRKKLTGTHIQATDLRAGAALILAGLKAQGETVISNAYHIDRGYERIEQKLSALGAVIRREQT